MFQGILEWVMDTKKKGDKEVQERIMLLQKEKDQVGYQGAWYAIGLVTR